MPRASYMDVLAACPANQTPVLKPQHTADRKSLKAQHNLDRKPLKAQHNLDRKR